jgi:hypothetical protein
MKRVGLMVCRLIAWAALYVVTLWVIGFCFGVGLGLEDIRREGHGLRFAVGIVVSVGMIVTAGLAWRWMFRLVRRLP